MTRATYLTRTVRILTAIALVACSAVRAEVLPEDRTDFLYHRYEGGGVLIHGPSILVRKKVAKNVSMVGNYYVDMVSSASIDVVTTASPYDEERRQWSAGVDYLRGDTTVSAAYIQSTENDFDAETWSFGVSQTMFGGLTTLSLAYAYGDDVIGKVNDPTFVRENRRQLYGVGLTQILTKNLITALNIETITDEGFMNNPYRSVRYRANTELGYAFEEELYPNTRTSNAFGFRARYYLPWRAAIQGEYRYFIDTWDIEGHTGAVEYVQPWRDFTFKLKYRWHDQTGAHFYRDLFPRSEATNFRGRDKELSPLTSQTISFFAGYEFVSDGWGMVDKASVNFSFDWLHVDYKDFRDLRVVGVEPGTEPLYRLDAAVVQLFVSFWY